MTGTTRALRHLCVVFPSSGRWQIQPSQNTHDEKRRHSREGGNPEHTAEEILRFVRVADAAQNDGEGGGR